MGKTPKISPSKMKSVCLLATIVCVALTSEEAGKSPRLFYVSTSASTTVISTAALCYVTSSTPTMTCPGRKKRRVVMDGETGLMVQPSQSGVDTLKSEDDRQLIENSPHMERMAGSSSIGSLQPQSPLLHLTLQPGVLAQSLALSKEHPSVDSFDCSFI